MFRHMRAGRHDQALYHATHGNPDLMLKYYESKQGRNVTPASVGWATTPAAPRDPAQRSVQINGAPLSEDGWNAVLQLENQNGEALPDGNYWYDGVSGAFGVWGYPTWVFLPPHLPFAGPVPPHCSGPPTHVYVNGRDIHPLELQILTAYTGPILPGQYFLDALGNVGVAGGPPSLNLRAMAGF